MMQYARPLRSLFGSFGGAMLALALIVLAAGRAAAQEPNFEQLPLSPKAPKWTSLSILDEKRAVDRMLRGGDPLDNAVFDNYFNEMLFPLMTQWRPEKGVSPLSEGKGANPPAQIKRRLKNEYLGIATAGPARDRLNDLILAKMEQIASGNFHPVVRVNAMLLVGELDEAAGGPLKKSLPLLLKTAAAESLPEGVRIAAMRGLVRQAAAGVEANLKPQVRTAVLAILNQAQPPAGHSREGHDWMRRRAIDVLAAIGDPGTDGAVAQALWQAIDEPSASLALRADAAAALSKIKTPAPPSATAATKSLGKVAVDAYKSELAGRAAHQLPIVPDRLKGYLAQVRRALVGTDGKAGLLAQATAAPDQQYIRGVVAQIDALSKACDTPLTVAPTDTWGAVPTLVDAEAPLAGALAKAGADLEATLERTGAAAPQAPGAPAGPEPLGQQQPATSRPHS